MFGRTYVILYFDPPYFCVHTSGLATITRITLEIELFTALNCFGGACPETGKDLNSMIQRVTYYCTRAFS